MTQELKAKVKEKYRWNLMEGDAYYIEVKLKKGLRTVYTDSFRYQFIIANDFTRDELIKTVVNKYHLKAKEERRRDDMTGKYKVKMIPSDGIEVKKVK